MSGTGRSRPTVTAHGGKASPAVRRGPGRRPGAADTRGEILTAAREEFAARGYDGATIRGIARAANVDPALVHHYFGGKEQVFVAAMELPFDPSVVLPTLLSGDQTGLAERITRFFLAIWSDADRRAPFLALLRSATTSEAGAAMLRSFVQQALLGRVVASVDGSPDPELRVTLVASHLIGLALVRYVVRVEPLASASDDEVVALVAPMIQRYLTAS
jgi:AcrR family transcriptional regulator